MAMKGKEIFCKKCGKQFFSGRKHRVNVLVCSKKCSIELNNTKINYVCIECGTPFSDFPSRKRKFCNKSCADRNKIGKNRAVEIIKKCKLCKNKFSTNRKQAKFCSNKCSCYWLSSVRNKGKNHPRYKGGSKGRKKYPSEFYKIRESVIARENGKCVICNKKGISVHHVDYDIKNNKPDNLVLLCNSCHAKTNSRRKEWEQYFKEKLVLELKY